jgi:hypothetical protein
LTKKEIGNTLFGTGAFRSENVDDWHRHRVHANRVKFSINGGIRSPWEIQHIDSILRIVIWSSVLLDDAFCRQRPEESGQNRIRGKRWPGGLLGAALSIVVAIAIKTGFYFQTVWKELRRKVNLGYVSEWLKGSAFNIYNTMGDKIAAVTFLMLAAYGGNWAPASTRPPCRSRT